MLNIYLVSFSKFYTEPNAIDYNGITMTTFFMNNDLTKFNEKLKIYISIYARDLRHTLGTLLLDAACKSQKAGNVEP